MKRKSEKIHEVFQDGGRTFIGFAKRNPTINSRLRRLRFIRIKNRISNGEIVKREFKIPFSRVHDIDFIRANCEAVFIQESKKFKERLKLKFKFPGYRIQIGRIESDYLRDTATVVFMMSRFERHLSSDATG